MSDHERALFEYGIYVENSDLRAHVSVVNRTIYVFQTLKGIEAIERHRPPKRFASQPGVNGPTALGCLVKPEQIEDMRSLHFLSWPGWSDFDQSLSTSKKGALAVACVCACMKAGRFPFWLDATEDDRENIQVSGTDILVFCRTRVQVKCDYAAGPRPAGTGHLFLQLKERNPLKHH